MVLNGQSEGILAEAMMAMKNPLTEVTDFYISQLSIEDKTKNK